MEHNAGEEREACILATYILWEWTVWSRSGRENESLFWGAYGKTTTIWHVKYIDVSISLINDSGKDTEANELNLIEQLIY